MIRQEHHVWSGDSESCAVCGKKRTLRQGLGIGKKLRVGMKMDEVQMLLGPPSAQNTGADAMRTLFGHGTSIGGSTESISSFNRQVFVIWRKPEGEYGLVFEGDRLVQIYRVP